MNGVASALEISSLRHEGSRGWRGQTFSFLFWLCMKERRKQTKEWESCASYEPGGTFLIFAGALWDDDAFFTLLHLRGGIS